MSEIIKWFLRRPPRLVRYVAVVAWLCLGGVGTVVVAEERDAEAAMAAALGHSPEEEDETVRPERLPDLTNGGKVPSGKKGPKSWNLGATGIIGSPNAWYSGDQIQVLAVLPGSSAAGKVIPGDVILGIQGQDFEAGEHLGIEFGNALIKAEEESGKGVFSLHVWRDLNLAKRGAPKDILGVDVDELIAETEEEQLYEWTGEEERKVALKEQKYDEFPIIGIHTNVTLQLEVIGTYSETTPWDCPVADKIRENALSYIAKGFIGDKKRPAKGSWPDVLALVASGNPEYVKLAKEWVHQRDVTQDMNLKTSLSDMRGRGYQSWYAGFDALEQAIYYDATGDKFILPQIRKRAIWTAMGQNGGGSWGHTFSFPEQNGGLLHQRNPGYGAMNNAGTRCFFLLTLAQKFGIQDPEIDAAIERASRFFGTYVDKGCIPYGYHPPYPSDDSNGKNYGATYAFRVLGDTYRSKYFAVHSANAAFSRRGGHGSATLWYYTPFSANVCGPRVVQTYMRNMRWFYTLARRHDGSFVFQGKQAGISGNKGMRNATATHALYYSVPLGKTIITGKDPDRSLWLNDEEYEELMINARSQITDPELLIAAGKPRDELGTAKLIDLLDTFMPKSRKAIADELGKRFKNGETDIVDRVLPLLVNQEARAREGACLTLVACGGDTVLSNLSKVAPLIKDPAEFVRMTAVSTISNAIDNNSRENQLLLLKSAIAEYDGMSMDNANLRTTVRSLLFPRRKKGDTSTTGFDADPFNMGLDDELVRLALEKIVTMDPGGTVPGSWSRDTVVKLAGPIVYVSSEHQMNDKMFGGARMSRANSILAKFGFRERIESDGDTLRKRAMVERDMRVKSRFVDKGKCVTLPLVQQYPSLYVELLPAMYQWLQDKPLTEFGDGKKEPPVWLGNVIPIVEKAGPAPSLPSLREEVDVLFQAELDALIGTEARIKHCRFVLADPDRKDIFRKLAALKAMADLLGVAALDDCIAYLGHSRWRLREQAHQLAVELVKSGGMDRMISLLASAKGEQAAGVLAVLRDVGDPAALKVVTQSLGHTESIVRKEAIQALVGLTGTQALPAVFKMMERAQDKDDFEGCELALLSRRDDASFSPLVRRESTSRLIRSAVPVRRSLAWVLAQLGGDEAFGALQEAAEASEDSTDVANIVNALSYSPDRAANDVLLAIAGKSRMHLDAVADVSVRRMVGTDGSGGVTDSDRVAFARKILNMKLDKKLITFLRYVHTGRSIALLFDVMKTGQAALAAESIVGAAEGMRSPPADENNIAVDALVQVIEFIEVNHLRGGIKAHMGDLNYFKWKDLQARAGKVLLTLHKPQKSVIQGFDDADLDI